VSEVGKKLRDLYEAMLRTYREFSDKEKGARAALEIYQANRHELEEISVILADIQDLKDVLEESLRALAEERAKETRGSRTIRGKGCIVVKLVPCGKNCSGCPHGPYAYEVTWNGGRQVWKYLGKAR